MAIDDNSSSLAASLTRLLPQIKTRVQLSAFLITAVVILLIRIAAPGNVPAQISVGMIGICIIVFTLVFNFLHLFEAKDRPKVILTLFIVFSALVVLLVLITGYLLMREWENSARNNKREAALSAIVRSTLANLESREGILRKELDSLNERKRKGASAFTFDEWKSISDEEANVSLQIQSIQGRREKIGQTQTQADELVAEISRMSEEGQSWTSPNISREAIDAQAAFSAGDFGKAKDLLSKRAKTGITETAEANFWLGRISELEADFENAERYYQSATDTLPDNPKYLESLASVQWTLGNLGGARLSYEKLVNAFRLNPARKVDLALWLSAAGTTLRFLENNDAAERYFIEAYEMGSRFTGGDVVAFASIANDFAGYCVSIDNYQRAQKLYSQSLQIYRTRKDRFAFGYASTLNNLGSLLLILGQYGDSEMYLKEALDLERDTVGTSAPLFAISTSHLANLLAELGRFRESELRYATALDIIKRSLGEYNSRYGRILGMYSEMLLSSGGVDHSLNAARTARDILARNFSSDHVFLSQADIRVAEGLIEQNSNADDDEVTTVIDSAARIIRPKESSNGLLLARIIRIKGRLALKRGDLATAESKLVQAKEKQEAILGQSHPELARTLLYLGDTVRNKGDGGSARRFFSRALEIATPFLPPSHPLVLSLQTRLKEL
jgi:tetratricopeptide (TPR) repeat protein